MDSYDEFRPSFTLDVPEGNRMDENDEARLAEVERAFEGYAAKLAERYKPKRTESVPEVVAESVLSQENGMQVS